MDRNDLKTGFRKPFFDILNVVVKVDGQKLYAGKTERRNGPELFKERRAKAEITGDSTEGICTDIDFHWTSLHSLNCEKCFTCIGKL